MLEERRVGALRQLELGEAGGVAVEHACVGFEVFGPADDARPLVLISFGTAPQGQAGALQHTLTALSTLPVRDLDVALYTTEEKDCLFAADIAARLRRETGFEVDVTVMNHTPVALQFAILRDGLLLFSNDEALRTALIERVSRQYREYAHFRDLFLGVAGARPQQDR